MSNSTSLHPFSWGDLDFSETLMIGGVPHMTRKAIGEFLKYADPQKAIDNLIDRNSHILEFSYPSVVRGKTGQNFDTFVYDPTGFLLIVMESEQPKAVEMKIAIARFVRHFTQKPKLSPKEQRLIRSRLTSLIKSIVKESDQVSVKVHWEEIRYLCDLISVSYPEIQLMRKEWSQLTLPGGYDVLLPGAKTTGVEP